MNTTARIQSAAGVATIVALPMLYIGGIHRMLPVTVIGFAVFAIGMLTTPALRFVPQRTNQADTNAGPSKHRAGAAQKSKAPPIEQERVE